MKNVKLLIPAVSLAVVSSLSLAAQQPAPSSPGMPPAGTTQPGVAQPAPGTQSTAPAVAVPSTANAPEVNNPELRPVTAELVSKLDSKNAKSGEQVVLKTTEKATIANGVVIPKGSKIMGHVTDVQAHDGTNPNSKIAIQFDQAELKGGQTMPIRSVLQSVAPAPGSDSAPVSPMGTGSAPSSPMPTGGAASTGSATGGANSGASSPSMPAQSSAAAENIGAGPKVGGPAAGTVVAHQGNIDIKTTGIPGVLIAAASNGQPFANASGALLGAKQNVHLDGGTQVTLAIADAGNKVSSNR